MYRESAYLNHISSYVIQLGLSLTFKTRIDAPWQLLKCWSVVYCAPFFFVQNAVVIHLDIANITFPIKLKHFLFFLLQKLKPYCQKV